MFKQLGVLGTFLAFAVALAVSRNVPSEVTSLPQQSLAIAQQSRHQARVKIQRSLQQLILRQQGVSSPTQQPVFPKAKYF
jgi:hypothetical protein